MSLQIPSFFTSAINFKSNTMDLSFHFLFLLLLSLVSLPFFLFLFLICIQPTGGGPNKLPPGKTGLPFFGESLEFSLSYRNGSPEKFITDRMKEHSARVFKTSLFGEKHMAVFCDDAGNKFLFSNENKFVTSWWPESFKKVFSFPRDAAENSPAVEVSRRARTFFSEFLRPESLRHYVAAMDWTAKRHLDEEWLPHEEVSVFPRVKGYTFALACKLFMKVDDPAHVARIAEPFGHVTAGLFSLPVNVPGTSFSRAVKAGRIVHAEVLAVVRRRRMELMEGRGDDGVAAGDGDDLVSRLLDAADGKGKFMNERQIASIIVGLLIASHDTTSSVITFIVSYLADYPHVYDEVFKEQMEIAKAKGKDEALNWDDLQKMKYSWKVASEVMRLVPPAQGAYREALYDFTYAGFTIPKGCKIHWSVHSTHRDSRYFPNPEKFDPTRFEGKGPLPYCFVPFGGGPRMCPGREFARLEILAFMHNLVTKFKWKKKLLNEKIVYTTSPIPVNGLPVNLQPHFHDT